MYIEQWTYYRVREQSVCNNVHSEFKLTYRLKEPNSASMYRAYYRVREQSVCNNVHSEVVQINLHPEGTKFSIHVDRAVDKWTYYRLREQSVCNNVYSEVVQINLQAEGTKFSIHVHRAVDILHGKITITMFIVRLFKLTYRLKEPNSASMYIEQLTYYRVREQSVCNNVHSEVVQINLPPEGTKYSVSMYIERWTYYRVREQSVCNNVHSELGCSN